MILIAKDNLQYPEYPVLNWRKGESYQTEEKGGGVIKVESETGPFFFTGKARKRLNEIFDFKLEDGDEK